MPDFLHGIFKPRITEERINGLDDAISLMSVRSQALIEEASKNSAKLPREAYSLLSDLKYFPEDARRKLSMCAQCIKEKQHKDARRLFDMAHKEIWELAKRCRSMTDILRKIQRK